MTTLVDPTSAELTAALSSAAANYAVTSVATEIRAAAATAAASSSASSAATTTSNTATIPTVPNLTTIDPNTQAADWQTGYNAALDDIGSDKGNAVIAALSSSDNFISFIGGLAGQIGGVVGGIANLIPGVSSSQLLNNILGNIPVIGDILSDLGIGTGTGTDISSVLSSLADTTQYKNMTGYADMYDLGKAYSAANNGDNSFSDYAINGETYGDGTAQAQGYQYVVKQWASAWDTYYKALSQNMLASLNDYANDFGYNSNTGAGIQATTILYNRMDNNQTTAWNTMYLTAVKTAEAQIAALPELSTGTSMKTALNHSVEKLNDTWDVYIPLFQPNIQSYLEKYVLTNKASLGGQSDIDSQFFSQGNSSFWSVITSMAGGDGNNYNLGILSKASGLFGEINALVTDPVGTITKAMGIDVSSIPLVGSAINSILSPLTSTIKSLANQFGLLNGYQIQYYKELQSSPVDSIYVGLRNVVEKAMYVAAMNGENDFLQDYLGGTEASYASDVATKSSNGLSFEKDYKVGDAGFTSTQLGHDGVYTLTYQAFSKNGDLRSGADSAAAADAEAGTASDPNASAYQLSSGDVTAGTDVTNTNKLITNAYNAEYEAVYQAYVDKKNGNQKAYMYDAQTGKLTELKVGSSLTVNNPSDESYDGKPTKISVKAGTFIYGNGVTLYNDNNGWYLDTGFQDNSYSTMSTYADTYASATPTDNTPGDSGNTNTSTETPEIAINSAVGNETDGFDVVGTATPNAEVTVRETNTRVNQTATAGEDGSYTVHFAPTDANVGDTVAAQSSIVDEAGNTLLSTEATANFTAENTAQDVKYTVTYSGAGDSTPATDTITVTWDQSTNGAGDTLWSPEAPDLTEGTTVTATDTGYTISVNSPAVDGYTADPVTATFDLSAGAAAPTAKNVDVTYTATGTSTPTSGTSTPTSGTSTPTSGTSTPTSGTSTPTSGTSTPTSGTS
ncbi:Ig-like domain-containing protein, partial [Loigolactobacillus backii]